MVLPKALTVVVNDRWSLNVGGHLSRFDHTFNNNWEAVTLSSPDVIMFTLTDIILLSLLCPEKTCRPFNVPDSFACVKEVILFFAARV